MCVSCSLGCGINVKESHVGYCWLMLEWRVFEFFDVWHFINDNKRGFQRSARWTCNINGRIKSTFGDVTQLTSLPCACAACVSWDYDSPWCWQLLHALTKEKGNFNTRLRVRSILLKKKIIKLIFYIYNRKVWKFFFFRNYYF